MLLIPAIDIKDGRCVRLVQGRMLDATVYADDPVSQADRWVDCGARRIHIVDLNGAFEGKPVNARVIGTIAEKHSDIEIQIGGGIRTFETARSYLEIGAKFVILGTRAVNEPTFVSDINEQYPGQVIAGLDVRKGRAAVDGWAHSGRADVLELARELERSGASSIVHTDIDRDGMLSGINIEATALLASKLSIPVIASGGISDIRDIEVLLDASHCGIMGAIAGKSLYEGTLDYAEAMRLISNREKVVRGEMV